MRACAWLPCSLASWWPPAATIGPVSILFCSGQVIRCRLTYFSLLSSDQAVRIWDHLNRKRKTSKRQDIVQGPRQEPELGGSCFETHLNFILLFWPGAVQLQPYYGAIALWSSPAVPQQLTHVLGPPSPMMPLVFRAKQSGPLGIEL